MRSLPSAAVSSPLALLRRTSSPKPRRLSTLLLCTATSSSPPPAAGGSTGNHAGTHLDETLPPRSEKSRLDSWVSARIPGVSRARIQASIRSGLAAVNGRTVDKVSHTIRGGDRVSCTIAELQPLRADPEDIPLDIVFEDAHVLVVNKPAHMVVHPAPGNANGTLVNAILHHCRLPTVACINIDRSSEAEECSESSDDDIDNIRIDRCSMEMVSSENTQNREACIRPGIVHRLDKGTSGLLVVAKNEHSHAHLAEQFKIRTIHRVYISLTSGIPSPSSGRVEIPIARDSNNRIRMAAVTASNNSRNARYAASRYKVIEVFMKGGSALVEWRLETGRTHQIRVHAKYLGVPLLGDELYGGTKSMALSLLKPRTSSEYHSDLLHMLSEMERPFLHALSLGFKHPHTGEHMRFSCDPPDDFSQLLGQLRRLSGLTAGSREMEVEQG